MQKLHTNSEKFRDVHSTIKKCKEKLCKYTENTSNLRDLHTHDFMEILLKRMFTKDGTSSPFLPFRAMLTGILDIS